MELIGDTSHKPPWARSSASLVAPLLPSVEISGYSLLIRHVYCGLCQPTGPLPVTPLSGDRDLDMAVWTWPLLVLPESLAHPRQTWCRRMAYRRTSWNSTSPSSPWSGTALAKQRLTSLCPGKTRSDEPPSDWGPNHGLVTERVLLECIQIWIIKNKSNHAHS